MRQTLEGGQPQTYVPYTTQGVEEYTGESILKPIEFLAGGYSYTPSPASQSTDPSDSILTPTSELPSFSPNIGCLPYSCPAQQESLPVTPSVTTAFPTPPPSASYTLDQGNNIPPSDAYNSLRSGAPSPTTWSSSNFGPLNAPQFSWNAPEDLQNRNTGAFVSPYEGFFPPQLPSSAYCAPSPAVPSQIQPETVMSHSHTVMASYSMEAGKAATPTGVDHQVGSEGPESLHLKSQEMHHSPTSSNAAKRNRVKKAAGKPYAQLIWEAFMSTPTRSMLLRTLYQWFRENTDKASTESKGWQNSIRHNLSMNDAFIRREGKSSDKKPSEWMLADWAINEGVQSTTRYRKGNSGRRGGVAGQNRSRRMISNRTSSTGKGSMNPVRNTPVDARTIPSGQPVSQHIDSVHTASYHRPASHTYPPDTIKPHAFPNSGSWAQSQSHTTTPLYVPEHELGTYTYDALPQNQVVDELGRRRQSQNTYSPMDFGVFEIPQLATHAQAQNSHVMPSTAYEDFVPTAPNRNSNQPYFSWDAPPSGAYN